MCCWIVSTLWERNRIDFLGQQGVEQETMSFPGSSLFSMTWSLCRAVLCTSTLLCLSVTGKAYSWYGLLTGCSLTVRMMLPPMEKWMSQIVTWTREILLLFCGLAFIHAPVKRSWKWSSISYVQTFNWTSVVASSLNALDFSRTPPHLVTSPQRKSCLLLCWGEGLGERVPSNGIILPGYPDPISQAPILSDVSFPPNYLQKTDELFQDSWLTLVQLERDTIQPQGTAGMDFANKPLGLIQLGPTWPERDF